MRVLFFKSTPFKAFFVILPMCSYQFGNSCNANEDTITLLEPKKNFDLELRERTRDTNFTLEDTQEMLETAWLAAAILTMVWSSPLLTETMTSQWQATLTVQRAGKEAGGSISNYLNDYKMCSSTSWLIFRCFYAHLNGVYYTDPNGAPSNGEGIIWYHWLGWDYSLKSTVLMMIKKN